MQRTTGISREGADSEIQQVWELHDKLNKEQLRPSKVTLSQAISMTNLQEDVKKETAKTQRHEMQDLKDEIPFERWKITESKARTASFQFPTPIHYPS